MVTKTHKEDPGLGVPEKKKKKKVVVKEAETRSSVLNSDNHSTEVRPSRARSPSKSVVQGQAPKMPLVKKKKKKKKKKGHSTVCEEHLEPETTVRARWTEESPSPRGQALGSTKLLSGEKKKKRKSSWPLAMSPALTGKTSPDPTQDEEVTRVGKKPKKHKKEKKAQEATAVLAQDPWFCKVGPEAGSVGQEGQGQAVLRQKRKQGSPREHTVKMKKKKKKKIDQEGDTPLRHPEPSGSVEGRPRKGSEKKLVKAEASEYILLEDGSKATAKKKIKSGKKAGQPGVEEPALKRKKKRRNESEVAGNPWEEVSFPSEDNSAVGEQGWKLGARRGVRVCGRGCPCAHTRAAQPLSCRNLG